MTFEDFYKKNINQIDRTEQDKQIIDEYDIELIDSLIKININYISDENKYEVFLCVVNNKYTKYISDLLRKTFDNKGEAYIYFNELKTINALDQLDEKL
jgi:hypothetical protein